MLRREKFGNLKKVLARILSGPNLHKARDDHYPCSVCFSTIYAGELYWRTVLAIGDRIMMDKHHDTCRDDYDDGIKKNEYSTFSESI